MGRLGHTVAATLLSVATIYTVEAQSLDDERSPYTEAAAAEWSSLLNTGERPYQATSRLHNSYFGGYRLLQGEPTRRIVLWGIDLCEGITPHTTLSTALRAERKLDSDTVSHGRTAYTHHIDPFADTHRPNRVSIGAYGSVGISSGGVFFSVEGSTTSALRYRVSASGSAGVSIYGDGASLYAGSLTAAIQKQTHHGTVSVALLVRPSQRGLRSASTDEAFELTGSRLYNPSWGYQQSRRRNSRLRTEVLPVAIINYTAPVAGWTLGGSLSLTAGLRSDTGLDRYCAFPVADHYRALPSGQNNPATATLLTKMWKSGDTRTTNIDWQRLYTANATSVGAARYALLSRNEQVTDFAASFRAERNTTDNLRLMFGATLSNSHSAFHKRVEDLLGGNYVFNTDYYTDDASTGRAVENDISNIGRHLVAGDRTGYNYTLNSTLLTAYGSVSRSFGRITLGGSVEAGVRNTFRRGRWQNSVGTSLGRSEDITDSDYSVEFEARYAFRNGHYLTAVAWCGSSSPAADDLLLNPESNNATYHQSLGVRTGASLDYVLRLPEVAVTASAFVVSHSGDNRVFRYYDDLYGEFTDMTATNLGTLGAGVECGVDYQPLSGLTLSVAASYLYSVYSCDATVSLYVQSSGEAYLENASSALRGLHTGMTPELTLSAEGSYYIARGWRVGLEFELAALRFVEPNPLYRMARVTSLGSDFATTRTLPAATRLGLNVYKEFSLRGGQRLALSATIDNIVGNYNVAYAYEQMRVRKTTIDNHTTYSVAPLKKLYDYPVTAFLTLSYKL